MDVVNIYKTIPKNISKKELINELLTFFSDTPKTTSIIGNILLNDLRQNKSINYVQLVELIGYLHQKSKENEKISNTDKRKHFGIYYTPYSIARKLSNELLEGFKINEIINKTFFEPCAGIGIFIIAYLDEIIQNYQLKDKEIIQEIINNIYYADIDPDAIELLRIILPRYLKQKYEVNIKFKKDNCYIGNVLFDTSNQNILKQDPIKLFNIKNKFDFILTNPPYRLLKVNSNKYEKDGSHNHYDEIKELLGFIRGNNIYKYNEGTLNYYKIFIEEILENYTTDKARVGLLIPNTLLNDKQSSLLRQRILSSYHLNRLYTIPEKNVFFQDISQAFCFFMLDKSKSTSSMEIINDVDSEEKLNNRGYQLELDTIRKTSDSFSIIITDSDGIKILKKISTNEKLGELGLLNLRGELDLTLHKHFITEEKTDYPLLKGINIDDYSIKGHDVFVDNLFLEKIKSKLNHVSSIRIVGQQISNMNKKKRLKFALINKNYILGNSCNYLLLSQNLFGNSNISLKYLLGILNSRLLDWRFRITNSNNHISNYEISELPIATTNDKKQIYDIEKLVDKLIKTKEKKTEEELNNIVFDLYGINEYERNYINKNYE
jgi:Alw26I/Eco31I/Esp3I family type II restriction m6 adenine DNA methyltransferase